MRNAPHPSYRPRLWVLAFSLFVLFTPRSGWSAPGWYYGPAQSTSIISCFSLIFPPPYFVTGVEVNVGQLLDATNPPVVGEVFFIQLTVAAIGDSCSGTFGAAPEFRLPPGVSPAISDETPLSCVSLDLGTQQVTPLSACPAAPTVAIWGGTHSVPAGGDISNAWVVPRGKVLMITLPVVASRPLSFTDPADRIGAAVKIIDSNLSPVLFPNVDAWVAAAPPPPVTPTPTPPVATPTPQPQPTVVPTAPPPLRLTTITAYEDAI